MYRRILSLLIFGSFIVTYADSAVQTDWSGGSGVLGPVIDWGDQFYLATNVEWGSIPGDIVLQFPAEYTIEGDFDYPVSVHSEDIDGDGDFDVLGAAFGDDDVTWWENVDGSGTSWAEHIVDGDFDMVSSLYSEDIDGDGDMDVLSTAVGMENITWWENNNGSGTSWSEHTIEGDFYYGMCIYAEDINGDGDMDVLGGVCTGSRYLDDKIIWWENVNGSGTSWAEHTIDWDFFYPLSIYSEDIDGDGDMDVLAAAGGDDDITWWENNNGSGTSWTEHIVDGDFDYASSVHSEDIDGDGDMDILGTASYADDITWWENINGSGTSWAEHTIKGNFNYAISVYSEDMDGDGDMDVLGAALGMENITWWENVDGSGTLWVDNTVVGDFNGAVSVYSEDINGDGYMDVLGAACFADDITWWDISAYSPVASLESSILEIPIDPYWDYLDWNSQTPSGTSVSFQIRASDSYADMGAWSDTLTSPSLLAGILTDGERYVQYRAILETSDPNATPTLFDVMLSWNPVGIEGGADLVILALLPFSPNPASAPTVMFSLPEHASVEISIFDLSGRLVSEISRDEYSAGYHSIQLDDLIPGIYFCRMVSGDFAANQRFVVID